MNALARAYFQIGDPRAAARTVRADDALQS
jgi:hypothetical protein